MEGVVEQQEFYGAGDYQAAMPLTPPFDLKSMLWKECLGGVIQKV